METTRTVPIDWGSELVEQLGFHWDQILRPRLDALTDEQLRWEPVPGMWGLRRREEATTSHAAGAGETVLDYEYPEPSPPPVTTIGWRLAHLAFVFGERAANHFGEGGLSYQTIDWPSSAAGMLELLDRHHDAWVAGVRSLGVDGLARPCGPAEGPYADASMAALVLHINREVLHHGAEVALLLDLFEHRHHLGGTP